VFRRRAICAVFVMLVLVMSLVTVAFAGEVIEHANDEVVLIDSENIEFVTTEYQIEVIEDYGSFALVRTDENTVSLLEKRELVLDNLEDRTMLNIGGEVYEREEISSQFSSSSLHVSSYEDGELGQYIVQMLGPVSSSWREALDEKVEVVSFVHNHAYRVRMTPEQAESVENLDFVDWVGIYQPGFRVREGLTQGDVRITAFPDIDTHQVEKYTSEVLTISENDDETVIRAEVGSHDELERLARINEIKYISEVPEFELHDEMATQIVGGGLWFFDDYSEPVEGEHWQGNPVEAYRKHGEYGSYTNQIGYTGEGVGIAIADTGIYQHEDFQERVVGGHDFTPEGDPFDDGHGHGTHVTGSAAGNTHDGTQTEYTSLEGYYSGQGTAPDAELFSSKIFDGSGQSHIPTDVMLIFEEPQQEEDIYVHSNSWGATDSFGEYTYTSPIFDQAVRDSNRDTDENEPLVITGSAGNDGYDGTPPPATSKNTIIVGGTENFNAEGDNPEEMYASSSRGFTDDNRIKPDVVAPASSIYSTFPDDQYNYMSGTSMSNPAVAGAAATVVEWYENRTGEKPSPALVRSIIINTANPIEGVDGSPTPNSDIGWGMADASKLERPHDDPLEFVLSDQEDELETGDVQEHFVAPDDLDEPLNITLTWTDAPAPEDTGSDTALINNLDLEIISPSGKTYRGNAYAEEGGEDSTSSYSYPETDAMDTFDDSGNGWDDTNNVQSVYIHPDNLEPGAYTIKVHGTEVVEDANNDGDVNQDYALTAHNAREGCDIQLHHPSEGDYWQADTDEMIEWTEYEGIGNITHVDLDYSTDGGENWSEIEHGIDPGIEEYEWTVADIETEEAVVRASVFDDEGAESAHESGHFRIGYATPPQVDLITPSGSEEWHAGEEHTIEWNATEGDEPLDTANLYYSVNEGDEWTHITDESPHNESYTWTIPDETSSDSLVKVSVSCEDNITASDMSDETFDLVGYPPEHPRDLNIEHVGYGESEWTHLYNADHRDTTDDAIGLDSPGTWYAGMRPQFPTGEIDSIAFFSDDSAESVVGHLHEDDNGQPGELIASTSEITELGNETWVEEPLEESISVTSAHYWIILEIEDIGDDEYPLGVYDGHVDDNAWISLDGTQWNELQDVLHPFNWAIEALLRPIDEHKQDHNLVEWSAAPGDWDEDKMSNSDPVSDITHSFDRKGEENTAQVKQEVVDETTNLEHEAVERSPHSKMPVEHEDGWHSLYGHAETSENDVEWRYDMQNAMGFGPFPVTFYTGALYDFSGQPGGEVTEVAYYDTPLGDQPAADGAIAHVSTDDGGAPAEPFLASSEPYDGEDDGWVELELNRSVQIDPQEDYWVVMELDDPGGGHFPQGFIHDDDAEPGDAAVEYSSFMSEPDEDPHDPANWQDDYPQRGAYGIEVKVEAPDGPAFMVDITDYPEEVDEEEEVELNYSVQNVGTEKGTQDIEFLVDGTSVDMHENIELYPDATKSGGFTWVPDEDEVGYHDLAVTSENTTDEISVLVGNVNPVSHYNIYRAEDETGPWNKPIAQVDADASDSYEFVDEETAGSPLYWYVVRSVSEDGVKEENEFASPEPGTFVDFTNISPPEGEVIDVFPDFTVNLSVTVEHDENHKMNLTFYDAIEGEEIGGVANVSSGESASVVWEEFDYSTEYKWYVEAEDEDGIPSEMLPVNFTTEDPPTTDEVIIEMADGKNGEIHEITAGESVGFNATAYDSKGRVIQEDDEEFVWNANDGNMSGDGVFYETTVGTYNVTAIHDDVVSEPIKVVVTEASTDSVIIEVIGDQEIDAGETVNFNATAYDEFENLVEDEDEVFEWDNATADGVFEITDLGVHEVRAHYDDIPSNPVDVTVNPGEIERVELEPGADIEVEAGESRVFVATVYNHNNVSITDDPEDFTWYRTNDSGEFMQTDPGEYEVRALYYQHGPGVDDTVNVTVTPASVHRVDIQPKNDITSKAGEYEDFTAVALDEYDNEIESVPSEFDWENAEDGVFMEETAKTYVVYAEYENVTSNVVNVTVEPADPYDINITPEDEIGLEAGEEVVFECEVYDEYDNLITDNATDILWRGENRIGPEGVFVSEDVGVYSVYAMYAGLESETVNVTVEPADVDEVLLEAENFVYPEEAEVEVGVSREFGATALDRFGNVIEDDTDEFDWSNAENGVFKETETGTYDVRVEYQGVKSEEKTLTVFEPAHFEVEFKDFDESVEAREDFYVEFEVKNTGGSTGEKTVELEVIDEDGTVIDGESHTFTLDAGESTSHEFGPFSFGETGNYDLMLEAEDEEVSDTFNVEESDDVSIPWVILAGVIAVALLGAGGWFFYKKSQESTPDQSESVDHAETVSDGAEDEDEINLSTLEEEIDDF